MFIKKEIFASVKIFLKKPLLLALITILLSDQMVLQFVNLHLSTMTVLVCLTGFWAILSTLLHGEEIDNKFIKTYVFALILLFLGKIILYTLINSRSIFFLVPLLLNAKKIFISLLKEMCISFVVNYVTFFALNKGILYGINYSDKIQLANKWKNIDKKIIYSIFLSIILFAGLAFFACEHRQNHLTQKDMEKIENKIIQIEKSNDSQEDKLKRETYYYKKLAKIAPEKYLELYVKDANTLVLYYFRSKNKIKAAQVLDESITFYENIVNRTPQYITIEAYNLYKNYFDYYRVRYNANKAQKYLDKAYEQVNYLLEKNPNNLRLIDTKRDILWWSRDTFCNNKSGNREKCLEISKKQVEVSKDYCVQYSNSYRLIQSLDDYIPLLVKQNDIEKATKTYAELISYFKDLSKKETRFNIYVAEIFINKNKNMYTALTSEEIEQNFQDAVALLSNNLEKENLSLFQSRLLDIAQIYERNYQYKQAEEEYLRIINEYKKFTLKDIESVQYLKYRYLDLYEKLIKFYTKNQMEQKAEKTKKEVKNICSYFAQNDAHVLKYYSCGEEEDMLKRNRLKK